MGPRSPLTLPDSNTFNLLALLTGGGAEGPRPMALTRATPDDGPGLLSRGTARRAGCRGQGHAPRLGDVGVCRRGQCRPVRPVAGRPGLEPADAPRDRAHGPHPGGA